MVFESFGYVVEIEDVDAFDIGVVVYEAFEVSGGV